MELKAPSKKYQSTDHLIYSCQYHVIFCPKYRRKVLVNYIEARLKELFYEIADRYNFKIIQLEVMPDHVHLLIDCNPRFGIANVVTKLKGITSKVLRKEFPGLKSKQSALWTRSTFISSVGSVSLEIVKQYIAEQKNV